MTLEETLESLPSATTGAITTSDGRTAVMAQLAETSEISERPTGGACPSERSCGAWSLDSRSERISFSETLSEVSVVGTPGYMAPELDDVVRQMDAAADAALADDVLLQAASPALDCFALGILLQCALLMRASAVSSSAMQVLGALLMHAREERSPHACACCELSRECEC